jgi:hypothetical protein
MPRKTTRSFKELAEVMIAQADWLATNHMVGISHSHIQEPRVAHQRDTADSMRIMELEG